MEGVDGYRATLALDGYAPALEVVESFAADFEGRGHRWDLEDFTDERGKCVADSLFAGHGSVERGDVSVCVQGVGGGAEVGRGGVALVQGGDVAGEAGGASEEEDQDAGGERVEGAGMADLRFFR